VEATDIQVASKLPGRVVAVRVREGDRVEPEQPLVALSSEDLDRQQQRIEAERAQAQAQLRLVRAAARPEDVAQAEAAVAAAQGDLRAVVEERDAAAADAVRFRRLADDRAGSVKASDDATARQRVAEARVQAVADRVTVAKAQLARVQAGARAEEVAAAAARVSVLDAQLAILKAERTDLIMTAPAAGIVTARSVEPGEIVAPRVPLVTLVDLDHAWVTAYVEEPRIGDVKLGSAARVTTDGGAALDGTVAFVSPRAEFTPRNVQTAAERARLVYRVRVTVDNRAGTLKPGMPVTVTWGPQ
jgi:HlyD family secretion protein